MERCAVETVGLLHAGREYADQRVSRRRESGAGALPNGWSSGSCRETASASEAFREGRGGLAFATILPTLSSRAVVEVAIA